MRGDSLKRKRELASKLLGEALTEAIIAERTGLSARSIRRLRRLIKAKVSSDPPGTDPRPE